VNIGSLLSKLQESGICINESSAIAVNVSRDLKISYFRKESAPLFLRILERCKGERDFAMLRALKSHLGDHIVEPTGIVTTDDLACGIFPFFVHEKLSYEKLIEKDLLPQVRDILLLMHACASKLRPEVRVLSPTDAIDVLLHGGLLNDAASAYFEKTFLAIVGSMAAVPQHCDFTYANLGTSTAGNVMVFDWEEFGLIQYPGFDFATFLISHYYHAKTIEEVLGSPEGLMRKIERDFGNSIFAATGFERAEFTRVFPGYLGVFLALKSNFGVKIFERLRVMWKRMLMSAEWLQVMNSARA
jgi:hypothetical protein